MSRLNSATDLEGLRQEILAKRDPNKPCVTISLCLSRGTSLYLALTNIGGIPYRLYTCLFWCVTCEFGQMKKDTIQQKLAKLAARWEALPKRSMKLK